MRSSQKFVEDRKANLQKAGLYMVLEEDVAIDNEFIRVIVSCCGGC